MCATAIFEQHQASKTGKSHAGRQTGRCGIWTASKWCNSILIRQVNAVYNRYIPQSDGSFQKNRIHEQHPQTHSRKEDQAKHVTTSPPLQPDCMPHTPPSFQNKNAGSFLKQLLPKNFDTGDLLIVLLLLLMAGDCEEEKSSALLTLALYFFM